MKNSSTEVQTASETLIYSPETKHLFPKEAQHFFEVITKQAPTQPKYYRAQKRMVIQDSGNLFRENPEMPLRQVILWQLSRMPDFLTGENLVQVVTYITETWAKCQTVAQEKQEPVAEEAFA